MRRKQPVSLPGRLMVGGFSYICRRKKKKSRILFWIRDSARHRLLHALGVPDKYIMERGGW